MNAAESRLLEVMDRVMTGAADAPPAGIDPWFFDYFVEYREPEARRRYVRALLYDLRLAGVDPAGGVLLDAGSGFGVTLLLLAALGPRAAFGFESFRPMACTAGRLAAAFAPTLPVATIQGSVHDMPLPPASVRFIYCNEALSHFREPELFLDECARVLEPGGRLMICDGNNALNPATVARVRQIWHRFEYGPPSDDFFGHRIGTPYTQRRLQILDQALPEADAVMLQQMAWGTYGRSGADIVATARRLVEREELPSSAPEIVTTPVDPDKGDYIERLIDARQLSLALAKRGFRVRVHAHFGGARNDLIRGINEVLRRLSPLTVHWARSVKIVAERPGP